MRATDHMMMRMQQRGLPEGAVALALDLGDWNGRGDRLSVGRNDIDDELRQLRRRIKELERLRRRGGATVVLVGENLITTYDRSRGGRV